MKIPFKGLPKALAALLVVLFVGLVTSGRGWEIQKKRVDRGVRRAPRTARRIVRNLRLLGPTVRRPGSRYANDRVLVRLRPDISESYAERLLQSYGFPAIRRIAAIGVYSVRTAPGVSVSETLAMLRRNGDVEQARPDYRTRLAEVPDDTYFSAFQYNLRNRGTLLDLGGGTTFQTTAGADIKATTAWDEAKGDPEIVIAVIDTGVDMTHPDLAAKIVSAGHDFANEDDNATDDHWHGTHVAGIAAADTDNAAGVAGVAWNCRILPVKVADANGDGYYSWMIDGIIWATDQGAEVINLSMGGEYDDPFLEEACRYAHDHGVVVIAAAGNHEAGDDATGVLYPAAYDNDVLAVAASDYNDAVADFSNFGPEIDVAAPGVWILAPIPQWSVGEGDPPYAFASGTSMAAPHASGMAALIKSLKPALEVSHIMNIIRYTADDVNRSTHSGRDNSIGYGRINMERALVPYILK